MQLSAQSENYFDDNREKRITSNIENGLAIRATSLPLCKQYFNRVCLFSHSVQVL